MKHIRAFLFGIGIFLITPITSRAHEVYVLPKETIQQALNTPPHSPLDVLLGNIGEFLFWAAIGAVVVAAVFFVSISTLLERKIDPWLMSIKYYAPFVARITLGVALIACGYYGSLFGPELPLSLTFGEWAPIIQGLFFVLGAFILVGKWVRVAGVLLVFIFVWAVYQHGWYMLTYTNYFGEIVVLFLIGAHKVSLDAHVRFINVPIFREITEYLRPYAFAILRVAFGMSLLYASLYAKFFYNALALKVAGTPLAGHTTSLAQVFGFSPEFLVLGAGLIEIAIALFFILGIEIRFTALFLEFWLVLSLIYFGEAVWPHLILIGVPIAFFLYGYDKYSLEGIFFKKGNREPVF